MLLGNTNYLGPSAYLGVLTIDVEYPLRSGVITDDAARDFAGAVLDTASHYGSGTPVEE